jgi:hypothetical protein
MVELLRTVLFGFLVSSLDGWILGFPFFESQAMWIAQLLSGKKVLPSWEEMMKSIKEFYQSREEAGIPTHDIADFEVKYLSKYSIGLKINDMFDH